MEGEGNGEGMERKEGKGKEGGRHSLPALVYAMPLFNTDYQTTICWGERLQCGLFSVKWGVKHLTQR